MKTLFLRISTVFIALFSISYVNVVWADNTNNADLRAKQACMDKESGDVCSFVNDNGDEVNGNCHNHPDGEGKQICIPHS